MRKLYLEQEGLDITDVGIRTTAFIYLQDDKDLYNVVAVSFVEWYRKSLAITIDVVFGDLSEDKLEERFLICAIFTPYGEDKFKIFDSKIRLGADNFGGLAMNSMSNCELEKSSYKELIMAIFNVIYLQETRIPWDCKTVVSE